MSSEKPKQQKNKKNKSKQSKGMQLWAKIVIVVLVIVAFFFVSYAHLVPLLFSSANHVLSNYALNLKVLSDVETSDDEKSYVNVNASDKCFDASYALQRDNTRSWLLLQGGLPSELGVKYALSSFEKTATGESWTPVSMTFSTLRTSADFNVCAFTNSNGELIDTLLTATSAAKVATFFGVVEESGGSDEVILNAPPRVSFNIPSVVTTTLSFTVTATDGPYSKPTKINISILTPQSDGTYTEKDLYTTPDDENYSAPVTVTATLNPGKYVVQVAASDNMYNVNTVSKNIQVK